MIATFLFSIMMNTTPAFDVFNVPDSYIESAYEIADQKLQLLEDEVIDEEIIEEDLTEEEIYDEVYFEEYSETYEETFENVSPLDLNTYYSIYQEGISTNGYSVLGSGSSYYYPVSVGVEYSILSSVSYRQVYFTNTLAPASAVTRITVDGSNISYVPSSNGFFICNGEFTVSYEVDDPGPVDPDDPDNPGTDDPDNPSVSMDLKEVLERLDKIIKYSNYEEFEDEDSFLSSTPYVNRFEYEIYKLLRYLVILVSVNIGTLFVMLFSWRLRRGSS